jgi:hypothetical protein
VQSPSHSRTVAFSTVQSIRPDARILQGQQWVNVGPQSTSSRGASPKDLSSSGNYGRKVIELGGSKEKRHLRDQSGSNFTA